MPNSLGLLDRYGAYVNLLSDDDLIDGVYEAAVVPDLWKPVLDQIARRADAAGTALLLISDKQSQSAIWSDSINDLCEGWISGGWQSRTLRAPRMQALNHVGFVTDCDIYAPGEREQDDAFANYLKPAGFGYGAGTGITMPTGEVAVYSIERYFSQGPMTREDCLRLDPFRPHLARGALLSGRAGLERARIMANTLETIGIPGAVIRRSGRLLAANPMFQELMPALIQDRSDRLRLTQAKADSVLADALEGLKKKTAYRGVGSIPVASGPILPPMIVHLIPVRGAANDFFLDASVIVMITPIDRASVPEAGVLQGLFDLTAAEAKVAHGIAGAQSVEAIALSLGIKRETVRTQLKAVQSKTGAHRQAELVSLLAGKAFRRGQKT